MTEEQMENQIFGNNNILIISQNNPCVEEISKEIRKYFELKEF